MGAGTASLPPSAGCIVCGAPSKVASVLIKAGAADSIEVEVAVRSSAV